MVRLRLIHSVPEPEDPTPRPCCPGCGADPYQFHSEHCDVAPVDTVYTGDAEADAAVWDDDEEGA